MTPGKREWFSSAVRPFRTAWYQGVDLSGETGEVDTMVSVSGSVVFEARSGS